MSIHGVSSITSTFSKLNPFSKARPDDEDLGDAIEPNSIGGGDEKHDNIIAREQLRVSHALRHFLVTLDVLSQADAGLDSDVSSPALCNLLNKDPIQAPGKLLDRSHPLTEYYISSSHNTYLQAKQLYGTSSAAAYKTALTTGSRCVEIDAWDNEQNPEEPKVTHGYTLASHILFREVCEVIRDVVDKEATRPADKLGYKAAPIMLSLENHCSANGQLRLVTIMKEVWAHRLLTKAVRDQGHGEQRGVRQHVTLAELGSSIVVIVEFHMGNEVESDSSDDEAEEESVRKDRIVYKEKKKQVPAGTIIPELAELGIYAQSVKPVDNSWLESEMNYPHHHLINVSESRLGAMLPANSKKISIHNSQHLMRIYPKGTRISSNNLNPVPFWAVGAQISALNWQTFGRSIQLNSALFAHSDGYILKPPPLRAGGSGDIDTGRRKKLRLHIAGATDVPLPPSRVADDIKPYVTCSLVHPHDALQGGPEKRKTGHYKQHKLGIVHKGEQPPPTDPLFDETLEWEYEDSALAFLRIFIKSDDKYAKNPILAVTAVRLRYVVSGWAFMRMLDLKGRETSCSLLLNFEFEDL